MRRDTNHALLISLGLHLILTMVTVPILIQSSDEIRDSSAVVLVEIKPVQRVRQRVLRQYQPPIRQTRQAKSAKPSAPSLTSATNTIQGAAPQAPERLDVAPALVTHADLPETDGSALPNANLGEGVAGSGIVGVGRGHETGMEGGLGRSVRGGNGVEQRFASLTEVDDVELGQFASPSIGLGIFDTTVMPGHGLVGTVYVRAAPIPQVDLFERCFTPSGRLFQMPPFEHLTPVYTFTTGNLNVSPRNYTRDFPTAKMESVVDNFAIRFRGRLAIETPGTYTFALNSDDGSKLYINQNLVVDNDGVHLPRYVQGNIELTAGMHHIEIHYFQGQPYQIALQWFYQPPNGEEQIVPPEMIYLPEPPRAPSALIGLQNRLKKIRDKDVQ
jgi:hypothetical protein